MIHEENKAFISSSNGNKEKIDQLTFEIFEIVNLYITNIAIDKIRTELINNKDTKTLKYFNTVIEKVSTSKILTELLQSQDSIDEPIESKYIFLNRNKNPHVPLTLLKILFDETNPIAISENKLTDQKVSRNYKDLLNKSIEDDYEEAEEEQEADEQVLTEEDDGDFDFITQFIRKNKNIENIEKNSSVAITEPVSTTVLPIQSEVNSTALGCLLIDYREESLNTFNTSFVEILSSRMQQLTDIEQRISYSQFLQPLLVQEGIVQLSFRNKDSPSFYLYNSSDLYFLGNEENDTTSSTFTPPFSVPDSDITDDSTSLSGSEIDNLNEGPKGWRIVSDNPSDTQTGVEAVRQKSPVAVIDPPSVRKPPRPPATSGNAGGDDYIESRNPIDFNDIEIGSIDLFYNLRESDTSAMV